MHDGDMPLVWMPVASAWCYVPTFVEHGSTAPKEVVDEINRLMADPCG